MRRSSLASLATPASRSLARWGRRVSMAAGLGALGCGGATTSLDTAVGTSAIATTTAAETTDLTTATGEPTATDEPVICPETCTPILAPTWTFEGPPGTHAVVEMLRDDDGALWLGTRRGDGRVGLLQLSAEGELLGSAVPGLTCERCELADIALHPSGDVLLSATSRNDPGPDQAVIARWDVAAREVAWVRTLELGPGEDTDPRIGELAVLDEERIVAVRVDGFEDGEELELLDFTADGDLRAGRSFGLQRGSGSRWPPLMVPAPTGEAVLAHAWWDEASERMVTATSRLVPPLYVAVSRVLLPLRLDDLAVDDAGRRYELARSDGRETITLVVTSRRSSDLERWSASLPLLTTSSLRAALAVGPDGSVYVAARTTPRAPAGLPYEVRLEVARWSTDGTLRWQAVRLFDIMSTSDPLELVVDDAHGVIVGTVVDGRPTVVRHEQACACD